MYGAPIVWETAARLDLTLGKLNEEGKKGARTAREENGNRATRRETDERGKAARVEARRQDKEKDKGKKGKGKMRCARVGKMWTALRAPLRYTSILARGSLRTPVASPRPAATAGHRARHCHQPYRRLNHSPVLEIALSTGTGPWSSVWAASSPLGESSSFPHAP